jgi:hypothetical protein
MSTSIGTQYPTQIPELSESADIQNALRYYHYGQITDPGSGTLNANSIAGYIHALTTGKAALAGSTFTGDVAVTATTASTSSTTGSLKTAGGLGVAGNANIGGNLNVVGSVTISGNVVNHLVTNAQSASYTLVLADDGKMIEMNLSSANNVTIPLNSSVAFPIGTQITIVQTGTGQTNVNVTTGVTLNCSPQSTANTAKLRAQWSSIQLIKRGTDTWLAIGDLG